MAAGEVQPGKTIAFWFMDRGFMDKARMGDARPDRSSLGDARPRRQVCATSARTGPFEGAAV